jgi:hypothetical protein
MKGFRESSLKEVLDELLANAKPAVKQRLLELRIQDAWAAVTNSLVQRYTQKLSLRGTTLIITITSDPIRQDILYRKEYLIPKLNQALKEDLITDTFVN